MTAKTEGTMAKFVVYRDDDSEWRWHLVTPRGLIALSDGGFRTKEECLEDIAQVKHEAGGAEVVVAE